MTTRYVLKIVCLDCLITYDVEVINPDVATDGEVHGFVSSTADFCIECESSNVERLGLVETGS